MSLSIKKYLLLNGIFLFFISLNNIFNYDLIDFTLLISVFLYSIRWSESEWLVPLFLFFWGLFQDILLGMNLGYSGIIFILFFFLSQINSIYGIFDQQNSKFIVFITAIFIFFFIKNSIFYFNYQLNYLTIRELSSFLLLVLLYFPINTFILYIQNKYEANHVL